MIGINDLRALVVLVACTKFIQEHNTPPTQSDLIQIVPAQWHDLEGVDDEFPYPLDHLPQIYSGIRLLRQLGLLHNPVTGKKRGRARKGTAYVPTAKGRALVAALPEDWREWQLRS